MEHCDIGVFYLEDTLAMCQFFCKGADLFGMGFALD
jgi:hypothetical protein